MAMQFHKYESAATQLVQHLDKKIVMGITLGIGKPIGFIAHTNPLYNHKSIRTIFVTHEIVADKKFARIFLSKIIIVCFAEKLKFNCV